MEAKKENTYRSPELYFHSLLHGVALIVPAIALGIDWRSTICLVTIVAVSHFVIDLWKVRTRNGDKFSYFVIDQVLHISVLVAIAFHMTDRVTIDVVLHHEKFPDIVMVVFAYLLILKPTSIVIVSILRKYPISGTNRDNNANVSGLVAGGELIGSLVSVVITTLVGTLISLGLDVKIK